MAESNHSGDAGDRAERALDRLIRAAMKRPWGEYQRPPEEAVAAYLLGVATKQQHEEVQAALVSSPDFRAEMLEAARELDHLETSEVGAAFDGTVVSRVPTLREFLDQRPSTSERRNIPGRNLDGLLSRILAIFTPPFRIAAIAVGAAALVLALMLPKGGGVPFRIPKGEAKPMKWDLGLDFLRPVDLRSVGSDSTIIEETAQEAAAASFREVMSYANGRVALDPSAYTPARPGGPGDHVLRALDNDGHELGRFAGNIPPRATDAVAVIFLLRAPSSQSYAIRMSSASMDLIWTGSKPDSGAVTFIYSIDGQFGAWRAMPFRFHKD